MWVINMQNFTNHQPVICIRNLNHYFGKNELRQQVLFDL